ncbi:MAG: DUF481 domain-containing protein [Bdellovibrionia bacterium]
MSYSEFKKSIRNLTLFSVLLIFCQFATAEEPKKTLGFHDESEMGIVLLSGNANSQSYNLKQTNHYSWGRNILKFEWKYLNSSTEGTEIARSWLLGTRFEREINGHFGLYLGQNLESDIFAGYVQRYNTDIGGKYTIIENKVLNWNGEVGYRFTVENGRTGQVKQNYLRLYTMVHQNWTETFSTLISIELLPNLDFFDYQFNSEVSAYVAINKVFAIKTGYLLKYRKIPVFPATISTDVQYTTALVAKF